MSSAAKSKRRPIPHRAANRRRARALAGVSAMVKHGAAQRSGLRRLIFALRQLEDAGIATGANSRKLSVRIDPGVLNGAAKQLGLSNPSDVVNASLALAAAPDRFKIWLRESEDVLPDDFELPV